MIGPDSGAWEAPRSQPDGALHLAIDGFEGPLDWLLEQVRAKRIDLARLSIAALVDAFEAALLDAFGQTEAVGATPLPSLARWGDWLVMAAELTVLRSRLLLADDAPLRQEAEAQANALRRRLLARAGAAAAARWLEARCQLGREVFARGRAEPGMRLTAPRSGDITGLFRACLVALTLPPDAGAEFAGPAVPLWSVADAVSHLRARLRRLGPAAAPFTSVLPPVPATAAQRPLRCRAVVASTLSGVLELARGGELQATQAGTGAEISLQARSDDPLPSP